MVRLVLLLAPIGSVLGGIAAGRILSWAIRQLWDATAGDVPTATPVDSSSDSTDKKGSKRGKGGRKGQAAKKESPVDQLSTAFGSALGSKEGLIVKRTVAFLLLLLTYMMGHSFKNYAWRLSADLSHPSIIVRARTRAGKTIKVDDYREAYWWLRDNTPQDSRILAWWDYGYQITAIANRTTIADGNTWNHEHIALLGKCLTTSIEEGHEIARHLADYVLIWGGGGGDDLAKSPHLARIANSVYRDHCPPNDPTCRAFGFLDRQATPSPMMARSLLYQLHGSGLKEGVMAPAHLFTEQFRSKYGKVRVYKIENVDMESRQWSADPSNRICDAPGSWFCPGQYPPGLANILSRKKDFAQLEDFNQEGGDEEYQRKYFEALNDPQKAAQQAIHLDNQRASKKEISKQQAGQKIKYASVGADGSVTSNSGLERGFVKPPQDVIDRVTNDWSDTETTTALWTLIQNHQRVGELKEWLYREPSVAYTRSADGRGPMWWAYEARNQEVVKLLLKIGVSDTVKDSKGLMPADLLGEGQEL